MEANSDLISKENFSLSNTVEIECGKQRKFIVCNLCDKTFASASNRNKHIKKVHKVQREPVKRPGQAIHCGESNCTTLFNNLMEFRLHLQQEHGFSFTEETIKFDNEAEFLLWKEDLEIEEGVQFIKKRGDKRQKNTTKQYFDCNRSGTYCSQSKGKRNVKESCKMGHQCTAGMVTTLDKITGEVIVKFSKEHYGHEIDLKHIRLPKTFRAQIAEQIKRGVSFDKILDFVRCSTDESFNRSHFLTRADIKNIQKGYGLAGIERHVHESTSVLKMFKELEELGDENPIVCFKFQRQQQGEYLHNMREKDVFIVIMHVLQVSILKQLVHKIICIDTTTITSGYNLQLLTVMVLDEFGEGFPAAWLICNRDDETVLINFFKLLRQKVGDLQPEWFVSDDKEQFLRAWSSVFGSNPKKLLSPWYLDRTWQQELKLIKNEEIQNEAYQKLCALRDETDETKFLQFLVQIEQDLFQNEVTQLFALCFKSTYCNKLEQWATCYRLDCPLNTSLHIDSLPKLLKHACMKGKINKILHRSILILLNFIRDKEIERINLPDNGKGSSWQSETERCHNNSLQLDSSLVSEIGKGLYLVAATPEEKESTVNINSSTCNSECPLVCKTCEICIHSSKCSCLDSLIRGIMCKHIHLVARTIISKESQRTSNTTELAPSIILNNINTSSQAEPTQSDAQNLLQQEQRKGSELLNELSVLLTSCTDSEKLSKVNNMLASAKNILQVQNQIQLQQTILIIPANFNLTPQTLFLASNKRPIKPKPDLVKSDVRQEDIIQNNLTSESSSVYQFFQEHTYASKLPL